MSEISVGVIAARIAPDGAKLCRPLPLVSAYCCNLLSCRITHLDVATATRPLISFVLILLSSPKVHRYGPWITRVYMSRVKTVCCL